VHVAEPHAGCIVQQRERSCGTFVVAEVETRVDAPRAAGETVSATSSDTELEDERRRRVPDNDLVLVVKLDVPTAPGSADRLPSHRRAARAAAVGEDVLRSSEVDSKMLARYLMRRGGLDQVDIIERRCQASATVCGRHVAGLEQ
jgi:hypothetical protein